MAKIPKSGIANAQTIQASHITNIIEALDGTGSYDIDATGSFSGSFEGSFSGDGANITGVTAEWDGTHVGNAEITGSLVLTGDVTASSYTGSFVGDGSGLDGVVATTLFALSEGSGISAFTFDGTSTQTINISGSVGLTTDTIIKWTGAAFADTSITDDGAVVNIKTNASLLSSGYLTLNAAQTSSTIGAGNSSLSLIGSGIGAPYTSLEIEGLNLLTINSSSFTLNPDGEEIDTIINSAAQTMIFVDSTNSRVGISKNAPNSVLDVNGDTIISGSLIIQSGRKILSSALGGLDDLQPTQTYAARSSETVTNSVSVANNISGSGVYPGMSVMIDLSQSTTNPIRFILSPIAEYTLGSSYVIYLADIPAGGTEIFRIETSGGGELFQGTIAAFSTPISINSKTTIETNAGSGNPGDRITITKISDSIWQVEGSMKDGSNWAVS